MIGPCWIWHMLDSDSESEEQPRIIFKTTLFNENGEHVETFSRHKSEVSKHVMCTQFIKLDDKTDKTCALSQFLPSAKLHVQFRHL